MSVINNQRALGAAVRDRRRNLDWTQATLASKVGVTRDWVIDLEGGRGNPQLRHLLRALAVLGLRLTVEPDGSERDAALDSTESAHSVARGPHRKLQVVDLDEVLAANRHRG